MSLYEGSKIRVRVDHELSGEFEAKVGCTGDFCCYVFFLQVDIAELARGFVR